MLVVMLAPGFKLLSSERPGNNPKKCFQIQIFRNLQGFTWKITLVLKIPQ